MKSKIKTKVIKGIITRLYDAGQDNSGQVNSFELKLSNGSKWDESIYVSNGKDMELFEVGKQVYIYYVFDAHIQLSSATRHHFVTN